MNKYIIAIIIMALTIAAATLLYLNSNNNSEERTAKMISQDKPSGGDFTIMTNNGELSLSDLEGKLVLLYFGYTFCPDICPTNLANLSGAYRQLSKEEQDQVQIVFISVDPNRDTPERLQQYSDFFKMDMLSGTSDIQNIKTISKNYGVIFLSHQKSEEDQHYAVDHSAFTYVIDKKGQLQTQLPHATTPDQFIESIRHYLSLSHP